jgi:hypothetical protein
MADLPGTSELRVLDCKGTEATTEINRIAPGVVSLVAELRAHERQAAEELERWKTHHASPTVITLALVMTDEKLDSLEKRAGDGEIAMGGRPGGPPDRRPRMGVSAWRNWPKGRARASAHKLRIAASRGGEDVAISYPGLLLRRAEDTCGEFR